MSHHPHLGPAFQHHPQRTLWIIIAVVVIAMVIATGVNALPGR
jgi:hypothetical protein